MKRLFTVISVAALLNLAALLGLGIYGAAGGYLTRDRVRAAVAALRGEEPDGADESATSSAPAEPPTSASESIQRNADRQERELIELARREREIQDNWHLLEAQQLAFLRDKEAFEEIKKRWAAEQDQRAQETDDSGLRKELEILSGIKPKEAKDQLKLKNDADVVRVLMVMEVRKARKLVSACKTEEERQWIGRILGKLHEQNAAQAEALGAGS